MSGFKMGRKLKMLVVGILAVALANSLQTSLANEPIAELAKEANEEQANEFNKELDNESSGDLANESNEYRQRCVAEVTEYIDDNFKITEPVKVLTAKYREFFPNYADLRAHRNDVDKRYKEALQELRPMARDDCNKLLINFSDGVYSIPCADRMLRAPGAATHYLFMSDVGRARKEAMDVLDAVEACLESIPTA
jgi:hypothetical protein